MRRFSPLEVRRPAAKKSGPVGSVIFSDVTGESSNAAGAVGRISGVAQLETAALQKHQSWQSSLAGTSRCSGCASDVAA